MKNILITGGAGFIGSNIALKLQHLGYNVTILDILSKQIHGNDPINTSPLYRSIAKAKIKFILGSVLKRKDWIKAIQEQHAIVHLAAETGTGQSMYQIKKYTDVNVGGTSLMLDILQNSEHCVQKVIVASSRAIYGEGKYSCSKDGIVYPPAREERSMSNGGFECKCPKCGGELKLEATDEESKIQPSSVYAITKQVQEQLVLTICRSMGIPSIAFRYQNVYGPGQSLSNPYTGILSIFSTQIKNRNTINIFEDGKESRDFVFIDDVVDATILGLESKDDIYDVFNVGSNEVTDILTVASTLQDKLNSEISIKITGNFRLGDIRHNYADLKKIKRVLSFEPKVDFQNGISRFCNWVNSQEIQKDNYLSTLRIMKRKGIYK